MSSVSELSDQNFESEEFNVSIYEQSNVQVNLYTDGFAKNFYAFLRKF